MTHPRPVVQAPTSHYVPPAPAQHYAPVHQYAPAPAPARQFTPAQHNAPTPTARPFATGAAAMPAERFALTPVHVGIAMTLLVVLVMIANAPGGSLKTMGAQSLPGPATLVPGQQNAGVTPVSTVIAGPGASSRSQVLPLRRKPSGMMSPAASASIAVERGGRAPQSNTQSIQMKGIPSPAAAATMAPQVLPLKASDGMTLPRLPGERDSAAAEQHYGDDPGTRSQTVPTRPAVTPAESAAMSEGGTTAASVNHPAFTMPSDQY